MEAKKLIELASSIAGSDYKLAKALKVSEGNVNDWRHGRAKCPPHRQVQLARIAGVDERQQAWEALCEKLGEARRAVAGIGAAVMLTFGATEGAQHAEAHGTNPNV